MLFDLERADEKRFAAFVQFLDRFVRELNDLAEQGTAVLVEGKRDARAMRDLGYSGPLLTVSALSTRPVTSLRGTREVVVLTDLDREGRRLASRHVRLLSQLGVRASLAQRRRLSAASRGVFMHIENLRRFAQTRLEPGEI